MVILFAIWTLACFKAALNRRPMMWLVLWLVPLALVAWDFLQRPGDDEYHIYPRLHYIGFVSISVVVAFSGVILLQRTRHSRQG